MDDLERSAVEAFGYRLDGEISEAEVADTVHWEVMPENAVSFSPDFRLDHAKAIRMEVKGTITLTPSTVAKCETDKAVAGPAIRIEVS